MKPMGLRQRFVILLFALFVLMFAAIAAILITRTAVTERSVLNEQSKSFATLATKPIGDAFLIYKDSGHFRIEERVNKFAELNPDVTGIAIAETSGKVLFSTGEKPDITPAQAASFDPVYITKDKVIRQIVMPLIEDYGVHRYAIIYSVSDTRVAQHVQQAVAIVIGVSIVAFALVIALTYLLINRLFIAPVRTISSKALKISAGNLEDQIKLNRSDELGDLAVAVNTMAESLKADIVKLQEADRLKSEFITISSHNLRTPLTVIKGDIEMMQEMGVPDKLNNMISDVSASATHLNNFIEDLLAISSMESGKLAKSDMQPGAIKDLLKMISDDYMQMAKQKKLKFDLNLDVKDERVVMSQHLLKIAIVNLLENAFKFTKEGSVSLSARSEDNKIIIKVADTGIGIAEQELPKLFTKFHRGTSIMKYDYEGTGIGLYLTKLIINDHKGDIKVESAEGKGTTFTITLPKAG